MAERQHQHRRPYPDTSRFGGDSGGDDQGRRHDGRDGSPTFWGGEGAFGQPDPVETPLLGEGCSDKGFVESFFLRLAGPVVTFHEYAHMTERPSSFSPP